MDISPLSAWLRLTQTMHAYFDTRPIVFSYEPGHGASLIEEALEWCNVDLGEEIYDQDKIQEVIQEYIRAVNERHEPYLPHEEIRDLRGIVTAIMSQHRQHRIACWYKFPTSSTGTIWSMLMRIPPPAKSFRLIRLDGVSHRGSVLRRSANREH